MKYLNKPYYLLFYNKYINHFEKIYTGDRVLKKLLGVTKVLECLN